MADVAELTAESTKEDIQSFVDDIAAARAGEDTDEKSDAQITSEHADNVKDETQDTTAAPTGDETAKPAKGKGEETGRDWFDEDLKAEVAAYGIDESELADYASREEVQRAMRLFDKAALEAGRKAMAESESQAPARDDKGRFVPRGETETKPPEGKPDGKSGYEVKLDKSVYDDGIVEEFTRLRDHYEARLETLEARFHEADARAEEAKFDTAIDKLDMPKLFGKTGSESKEELQKRQDVLIATKAQILGLAGFGRSVEMSYSLISRMARILYPEEFAKKDLKSRTSRIARQSNGRQGGGVTRPNEPRESPRDEADRLYRELAGS